MGDRGLGAAHRRRLGCWGGAEGWAGAADQIDTNGTSRPVEQTGRVLLVVILFGIN